MDPNQNPFTTLDIRVGKIGNVREVDGSDKLFCEEVDVGLDAPLQIVSGLRKFYSLKEMENRLCLVLVNLKPKKMAGVGSHGMVLCAKTKDGSQVCICPLHDSLYLIACGRLSLSSHQQVQRWESEFSLRALKEMHGAQISWRRKRC